MMAASASKEKPLYDAKNFKTYYSKLKAKCMQSADAASVMLGIFSDPIREMESTDKSEYDKLTARLADLATNAIDGIDVGTTMPTVKTFKEDPVKNSKLFVKVINNTATVDAAIKTKTLKAAHSWLKGEVQIYGHAVASLVNATHLIYKNEGAGRKQLDEIMESVEVKSKQATQALLINLEAFQYDMKSAKDSNTKGEGIQKYKQRLKNH